jgi:hypothetical protein
MKVISHLTDICERSGKILFEPTEEVELAGKIKRKWIPGLDDSHPVLTEQFISAGRRGKEFATLPTKHALP